MVGARRLTMGYDLIPRNKSIDPFYMGAFSWPWMLGAGVGLVIGTGKGIEPAQYYYAFDNLGRDPNCNDGFRVTASQARAMSLAAWGLVFVERAVHEDFAKLPEEERKRREDSWPYIYRVPVREDFIEKAAEFAEFAERSSGFSIK